MNSLSKKKDVFFSHAFPSHDGTLNADLKQVALEVFDALLIE